MINFSPILKRFVDKAPLPVMMRALLQRELDAVELDRWFETVAQQQYTRKLLFSTLFELMTQVVLRQSGSIRAAWLEGEADVGVSLASVYNKLNGLEPGTSAALVSFAAERSREVIDAMPGGAVELLAGLPVRVLDGNCLDGRQHRLQVTRESTAAPLPGKALVVFDPQRETIEAMVPCEDGHTQERKLLGQVGPLVGAGQVWLADRNFCTEGFLGELEDRGAYSLIREHDHLRFTPLEAMRGQMRPDGADSVVSEQWVQLKPRADGREGVKLRRIRVELDTPTRHGETELYLLSTVPERVADAPTLARLYRQRWTIERAFLHLTVQLRCEVNTLSYPPAALFALACAMVVFNVLGVVKAALRAAHGAQVQAKLSSHAMATHMRSMAQSFDEIVEAEDWQVFNEVSTQEMARWLLEQAALVPLKRYAKAAARKAPPRPAVKRAHDPKKPHVSLAKLLAAKAP